MALASEPAALKVKNAALKDAANRAAMKLGYTRGMTVGSGGGVFVCFFYRSSYQIWEESLLSMPAFCFRVARGD